MSASTSREHAPRTNERRGPAKPTQQPTRNRQPTPLTHHDIMRVVAPFSRRGYALDLEHSDRARRALAFKGQTVDADSAAHPPMIATLRLELPQFGRPRRLLRSLVGDGVGGTLVVEGQDLELMISALELVAASRQIRIVDGTTLCRDYRIDLEGGGEVSLTRATATFDGMVLQLSEQDRSVLYDAELTPPNGEKLALPQDFFAVSDARWRVLRAAQEGAIWRSALRAPMREPARTNTLEALFDEAVAHIRQEFASDPRTYHQRYFRARWRVVAQRILPMLVAVGGSVGAILLALALPKTPLWHMVLSQLPIVVICAVSMLKETPKLELPPLPQPLPPNAWHPLSANL